MNGELPQSWATTTLAELMTTFESGSRPRGGVRGIAEGIPSIGGEHLNYNGAFNLDSVKYVPRDFAAAMTKGRIQINDILIVKDGATTGKTAFVDSRFPFQEAVVNEHVFICRPTQEIEPRFLFRFLMSKEGQQRILENFQGSAQGGINQSFAPNTEVPLAPLAEQQRIVAKLELLLGQVDACQQRLDKIPTLLKRFRQSVLAAACSGRLTEDWRGENPHVQSAAELLRSFPSEQPVGKKRAGHLWGAGEVPQLTEDELEGLPETWVWTKVSELGHNPADAVQVGPMSMQSRDFTEEGVPVLNVGCVQWNGFDESKLDHMPPEKADGFSRYKIAADDILFTRSGTVGRCALAKTRQNGWLMTFHLLRVRPNSKKCLPKYLLFVLRGSPNVLRQTTGAAIGSTRAGFNTRLLAELDVPVPPMSEQQEIVRRVESLFALVDNIEQRYKKAQAFIDKLTPSLLAKAFRGELVPQDPNDEPAGVLLGRIGAGREKGEPRRRGAREKI